MDFKMETDLAVAIPQTISFNFDQLKSEITQKLEDYNNLVVTEDNIKGAKDDRANLNKFRKALDDSRKDVKKVYMAPLETFEAQMKELVGLIDKPISVIDAQLDGYEQKRREGKKKAIRDIYEEAMGGENALRNILTFERLWDDQWYNTAVTLKKVRESITATMTKVEADLTVLSTVESEFMEAVKLKYLATLDVSAALQERARLKEQANQLRAYEEERRKREVMEGFSKPSEAPRQPAVAPAPVSVAGDMGEDKKPADPGQTAEVKRYPLCFECMVSMEEAAALKEFLVKNNIKYRRV